MSQQAKGTTNHTPVPPQDHDVLVFPRASVAPATDCFRMPVNRVLDVDGTLPGAYTRHPRQRFIAGDGQRKALSVMHPELFDGNRNKGKRGPAFAAAPVKAEPTPVGFCTCFMINAEYFTQPNLWTVEEWNDTPGGVDYAPLPHPSEVEMLIALPWGQVVKLHLHRKLLDGKWQETALGTTQSESGAEQVSKISRVDLREEAEVWSQLRNGCIAGRSWFEKEEKVIPLVNITALLREPKEDCRHD